MYTLSPALSSAEGHLPIRLAPEPVIYSQLSAKKPGSVFSHMAPPLLWSSSCLPFAPPTHSRYLYLTR